MKTYRTIAGDMWDLSSFKIYGTCNRVEDLINANRDKIEYFVFPAGIELRVPDINTTKKANLPPWRRVAHG